MTESLPCIWHVDLAARTASADGVLINYQELSDGGFSVWMVNAGGRPSDLVLRLIAEAAQAIADEMNKA